MEADIPKYLCHRGTSLSVTPLEVTVGDLIIIVSYYLLRVGEYMYKDSHNNTKQMVQFHIKDVIFF